MLGVYMLVNIMSFWWIVHFSFLNVHLFLFLPLFILRSFYLSIATPTFLWMPFAWSIYLPPLHLEPVCLWSWDGSLEGSIELGLIFKIHAVSFHLLIGEFSPFKFRVIIDIWRLLLPFSVLFSDCLVSPLFLFLCVSVSFFSLVVVFYNVFLHFLLFSVLCLKSALLFCDYHKVLFSPYLIN